MKQLYTAWKNVFNNRDIIHVQHQIYALSTDMDAAYNRVKQKSQQSADETNPPSLPLDTSPPSEALHAIKNSLDYWHSAIEWLGSATAQALNLPGVRDFQYKTNLATEAGQTTARCPDLTSRYLAIVDNWPAKFEHHYYGNCDAENFK